MIGKNNRIKASISHEESKATAEQSIQRVSLLPVHAMNYLPMILYISTARLEPIDAQKLQALA